MLSLFALVLFSLSLFMTPPVADIAAEESLTNPVYYSRYNPQTIADYPVNYTQVDWDLGTVNEEHNQTWNSNHYRFGPTINWHTRYTNGTFLGWQDEIAIDEYVDFIVEIPFSALGGQTPAGVYLMGGYFNMSALANTEGEFRMEGNDPNMWMVYYNITGDTWLSYSNTNATWPEHPPTEIESGFSIASIFGEPLDPYLEMDPVFTGYTATAESYWANVRVRFNSSTIGGFYTVSCGVQDAMFQSIAESRFEEFKSGRIVGTTFDFLVNQAVGGYYDWERVSDDGSTLYSATRNVDFNMTATIANGTQLANVSILFDIPDLVETQIWTYGTYTVTEQVTGVWEFDDVSETYFWNATKVVNWTVQREGYHYEDGFNYIDTGKEYTMNDRGSTHPQWTWGRAAVVFDVATGTWTNMLAYDYENYTWVDSDWQYERWMEYEPWPMDDSIPLPYILNEPISEAYWDNGNYVVTFRGHMSDAVVPTSSNDNGDGRESRPVHVREQIVDIFNRNLAPSAMLPLSPPELAAEYRLLEELAIESPVSLVTLTHEGEPYQPDWMFRTDVSELFTVKSWLQGGADYFEDIDGVGFFMKAYQDDWGFDGMSDWHQWSEIEIQIRIDPHGGVEYDVFNRTVRTQWSYGEHWDWVMVEVMPGRWEPQWMMFEDWFWEENTWDFLANDWAPGWLSMNSPNLKMPVHWLDVLNLQQHLVGNDLRVIFDIQPSPELPQLEWKWNYFYGQLAWVEDYESGWGEHTILGWNEDIVYSYINGTKLYMEEPIKAEIFRNNLTGDFYQREKVPFVEINGEEIDLDPYYNTDMDATWVENVRTDYDHDTGEDSYFIRFANGTEIQIYEGSVAVVYNISLPMQGDAWFLAWGDQTFFTGYADEHSMLAINGTYIVGDWATFWDMYMPTVHEVVPTTMVDHTYMTTVNGNRSLYLVGWPDNIGLDHYVMYLNETYEAVDFWWNPIDGYHFFNWTEGGSLNKIAWPWELMTGVYQSNEFFIPHYLVNSHVYTIVGGEKYQLPAPGIPMWSVYELNNVENIYDFANQRYFAKEYAVVDGMRYEAIMLPGQVLDQTEGYWYDVYQIDTGVIYNLTDWSTHPNFRLTYNYMDYWEMLPWSTIANGSIFVPEVVHEDWNVAYGHRDPMTFEFIVDGWFDLRTGRYDGNYQDDFRTRIYEYDDGRGYDWVETMVGEEFSYNYGWKATFMNVTLANGTFFYSKNDYPIPLPLDPLSYEIDTYYMIDIYGVPQYWQGWMDYTTELIVIDDVIGVDPWSGGQFYFEGMYRPVFQYFTDYWDWDGSMWYNMTFMEDNIVPYDYFYLQSILNGSRYEIVELQRTPESFKYNFPSWAFNVTGTEYHAYGNQEVIYQAYRTMGYSMKLDYTPLPVTIISSQGAIVYGAPRNGMWEHDVWTVDPLNGALDLDGDLGTTFDQFYVREIHSSTDYFNITQQYLDVSILWEPDNTTWADEFYLHSYTGMVTFNWTYDWSEMNIWTHTDGTSLTAGEYAAVQDLLFDSMGNPAPGYWGISWMFENRTYVDMLQQAQDEGWDWVEDNSQEWSWLWWELQESYSTEVSNGTHSDLMDVNLAYQYAGMFAWNDTNSDNFMSILTDNEITHYWMPVDVESVSFTTPGEGWGNFATTGSEYRGVNETIDFGVTFSNVTGVVYPFGERSYFDWYEGTISGSDFADFDERPSECLTEEFSIDVHFTGEINATGGANTAAVKFDIGVGQWDVDFPSATNPLEGMSLAVAFFSDLNIMTSGGMTANASYIDDDGQVVTNDQEEASLNFTMASGLSDVAMMGLGGAPYDWAFNSSYPSTAGAQTVPLSTFSEIYVSGGGNSATTFAVTSHQFYTVLSFKWWDGYAVYVDPVFVGYISHGTTDSDPPEISGVSSSPYPSAQGDYVRIQAQVTDSGGSDLATVKVYDMDLDTNHTMTYDEGSNRWIADILRTDDAIYTFNYQIIAEDNAGNAAVSSAGAFVFRDNIDPVLGTLSTSNTTDGYGNEIAIVSLTVTDAGGSGVDTVTLTYSNTTGDFNVAMALNAGSYEGTIPNHDPGTTVDFWVTAADADGNSVTSSTDQFTFDLGETPDTFAPSIASIVHDPDSPEPTDTVTISANVYDATAVDYVTLQYKIDSGDWVNVSMTGAGDAYSADIPAQVDGTTVTYRLVAMDTLGNEAISSENFYTVAEPATTSTTPTDTTTSDTVPTTTTGGGDPGPLDDQTMMLMLGGVGALVLVIVIVVAMKKRN